MPFEVILKTVLNCPDLYFACTLEITVCAFNQGRWFAEFVSGSLTRLLGAWKEW